MERLFNWGAVLWVAAVTAYFGLQFVYSTAELADAWGAATFLGVCLMVAYLKDALEAEAKRRGEGA